MVRVRLRVKVRHLVVMVKVRVRYGGPERPQHATLRQHMQTFTVIPLLHTTTNAHT